MSSSNCCFLTCIRISQEAVKVAWYSLLFKNFAQIVVIHTVKSFGIINKTEVDVFRELSYFFCDSADVGNLISGSSAFSKISLNIWNFMVHVLLKPGLENFKLYFTSMWDECNCVVVWAFFCIAFLWDGMKTDLFQYCGHCWNFQICWLIEWITLKTSSFRIWKWKILKEMGIPDHLTCLLRNLYAGQEATVRTGYGTTNWFQIGKGSTSRLYIVTLLI